MIYLRFKHKIYKLYVAGGLSLCTWKWLKRAHFLYGSWLWARLSGNQQYIRVNIFRMEKQNITTICKTSATSVLASALNFTHLAASLNLRHNRDLARAKINGKFHLSFCGLTFEQNSRKIKQSLCILMIWTFTVKYAHIRDFAKQKS